MEGCSSVQWEYRKIDFDGDDRNDDDLELLSEVGRSGWELIIVTANRVAYLKRAVKKVALFHRIPDQELVDLVRAVDFVGSDRLVEAVVGDTPEHGECWRINWLKILLKVLDEEPFQQAWSHYGTPTTFATMLQECREMVQAVNDCLSKESIVAAKGGANSGI
jgi:hypothetical protein